MRACRKMGRFDILLRLNVLSRKTERFGGLFLKSRNGIFAVFSKVEVNSLDFGLVCG
jgi:hypothetical protein